VFDKVFYYVLVLPLEIALVLSGFFIALIMPPSTYFLYTENGIGIAYIGFVFSSFGLMMVLLIESMFYLKWKALTKSEYKKVLGNRSSINFFISFSSDIYSALEFGINKYSSNTKDKKYKKLVRLFKLHKWLNYVLILHMIVCAPVALIYSVINL